MSVRTAWICCLLAGTVIFHCEGIKWLGLFRYSRAKDAYPGAFSQAECHRARAEFGFRKRQLRFCKNENYTFAMSAILYASKAAIYHCGKTFADRRWNCSSMRTLPRVSPDLQRGTREQAFVYAFASAALIYAIGKSCATGDIRHCPCDRAPQNRKLANDTHRWGGCHDNLRMAEDYVVRFLGLRRKRKRSRKRQEMASNSYPFEQSRRRYFRPRPAPRTPLVRSKRHQKRRRRRKRSVLRLMNHHNYEAGIRMMDHRRSIVCKCHGVSGSCSARICFYRLTRIDDAALTRYMRENYVKAVWVKRGEDGLVPVNNFHGNVKPILPTDLVFVKHSPDYCLPDPEVGSFGTIGRRCNSTISGSFKCENMCCGRGYHIKNKYVVDRKCNCKLTQNYVIQCTPCRKLITQHVCN